MKIAVIGSGISGLSASYYLSKKYIVALLEKEDHFGGHSHTIDLEYEKETKSLKSINLDSLSVDELRSYIEQLKNEIARITLELSLIHI